jgi:sugar phosphate isomerase/epimerase
MNTGFQLKVLATNWGYQGSLDAYCAKVKEEGYDGIEIWWPGTQKEIDELFAALKKYNLEVGFLTAGHQSNYAEHLPVLKQMITAAATNKSQRPLYINCHSEKIILHTKKTKPSLILHWALQKILV